MSQATTATVAVDSEQFAATSQTETVEEPSTPSEPESDPPESQ